MTHSPHNRRGWTRRGFVTATLAGVASQLIPFTASAQSQFPEHLIKLVVPYPPGGANDSLGRAVAQRMAESLKQAVVVENRGGAGGLIGTQYVVKAPSDGYTLLVINALPHTASTSLYKQPTYDAINDFTPISMMAETPYVLTVNSESPFQTFEQFIEYARANPGKLNYASGGQGGATHLVMEQLRRAAKIDMLHVPYRGGGPALSDLMGGMVDATFENMVSVLPMINGGKLRPLAVSSNKPSSTLPHVPTVESKLGTEFNISGRFAIVAPAGVPRSVVDTLYTSIASAVKDEELITSFQSQGIEAVSSTPEQLKAILESEQDLWSKVIAEAGIQLD